MMTRANLLKKRSLLILFIAVILMIVSIPVKALEKPKFLSQIIAQKPDLSQVVITLEDLPAGFKNSTLETIIPENNRQITFSFERNRELTNETIMGHIGLLGAHFNRVRSQFTKTHWQELKKLLQENLSDPQTNQNLLKISGEHVKIIESKELPVPEDIGNVSVGQTMLIEENKLRPRIDNITFIRNGVISTITLIYFDGDISDVSAVDIARKLDLRIQKYLP